jgi:hypothetical protein
LVKPAGKQKRREAFKDRLLLPGSWQKAGKALIDEPFPEDGTDFFSYATGAPRRFPECDRCCVVVVGHADHADARTD